MAATVLLRYSKASDDGTPAEQLVQGFHSLADAATVTTVGEARTLESSGNKFTQMLYAAAQMPGVRIKREACLRSALKWYCTEEQLAVAIADSPAAASIPLSIISQAARTLIKYETSKVTVLSTAAGIPGGLAMVGTLPADAVQYVGHMLRIAQKLAYLYGWPDLFEQKEEFDEATKNILILFLGIMLGTQMANQTVTRVAGMIAKNVAKKLPQQALTKGVIYPVVKKVAGYIGINMTKRIFANGVAKVVPVIGAVVSGGVTLGTFLPMAKRLQKHLADLELAKPGLRHS